jgi:subtilisin family serine protease
MKRDRGTEVKRPFAIATAACQASPVKRASAACAALLALTAPSAASAAVREGFVDLRMAADRVPALPTISPPPRLNRPMRWYHLRTSSRALLAESDDFGPAAVVGLRSMGDLAPLRRLYRFAHVEVFPELRAAEVSLTAAQRRSLLASAPRDPRIRYVSPIGPPRQLERLRNDPMLRTINPAIGAPYEWEFAASRVDRALNLSAGSPTITIGVLDSGVADVPDLKGKIDSRWYFTGQVQGSDDLLGHGTAVASIIAANNDDGFGMAGFGGATHIISFRDDLLTDESIALGVAKLVALGVRVINISAGGARPASPILVDALTKAENAGVLIVGSAGNNATSTVSSPAAALQPSGGGVSYGLAVGASDFDGARASFSNTGANLSLIAPGNYLGDCTGVLAALSPVAHEWDGTCYPLFDGDDGARYTYAAGTSFAAPEVAGAAALLWAAAPNLKNFEVATILKRSAHRDPGASWSPTIGWGTLDVAAALEDATGRSSADVLTVSGFGVAHGSDAKHRVVAQGSVTWADGTPPDTPGTVACSASAAGLPLQAVEASLVRGVVTCAWPAKGLDDRSLSGTVTVTDQPTGVSATMPFRTTLGDLTPPTAQALHATGRWRGAVMLGFTGQEETGAVLPQIVVRHNGKPIAHLRGSFVTLHAGGHSSLAWHAPAPTGGAFSFCVVLADRAGNQSAQSCAPISLG